MITLAKKGDLHARRQALSYIMDKSITHKLFDQMRDRFSDRQGGYIRILKTGHRTGDNAPLVIIQLLLADEGKSSRKTIKKRRSGEKKITDKVSGKKTDTKGKTRVSEDKQEKVEKP
jgi:large subunit ribosomal protein L17